MYTARCTQPCSSLFVKHSAVVQHVMRRRTSLEAVAALPGRSGRCEVFAGDDPADEVVPVAVHTG